MPDWMPEDEWNTVRLYAIEESKNDALRDCPYCRQLPCDCEQREEMYADS